jgi:hypothetical protein
MMSALFMCNLKHWSHWIWQWNGGCQRIGIGKDWWRGSSISNNYSL